MAYWFCMNYLSRFPRRAFAFFAAIVVASPLTPSATPPPPRETSKVSTVTPPVRPKFTVEQSNELIMGAAASADVEIANRVKMPDFSQEPWFAALEPGEEFAAIGIRNGVARPLFVHPEAPAAIRVAVADVVASPVMQAAAQSNTFTRLVFDKASSLDEENGSFNTMDRDIRLTMAGAGQNSKIYRTSLSTRIIAEHELTHALTAVVLRSFDRYASPNSNPDRHNASETTRIAAAGSDMQQACENMLRVAYVRTVAEDRDGYRAVFADGAATARRLAASNGPDFDGEDQAELEMAAQILDRVTRSIDTHDPAVFSPDAEKDCSSIDFIALIEGFAKTAAETEAVYTALGFLDFDDFGRRFFERIETMTDCLSERRTLHSLPNQNGKPWVGGHPWDNNREMIASVVTSAMWGSPTERAECLDRLSSHERRVVEQYASAALDFATKAVPAFDKVLERGRSEGLPLATPLGIKPLAALRNSADTRAQPVSRGIG